MSPEEYDGAELAPQELTHAGALNAPGTGFVHSIKWHTFKSSIMTSDGSTLNIWAMGETPKVRSAFSLFFLFLLIFDLRSGDWKPQN